MFAFFLATMLAQAAPAYTAACPNEPTRVLALSQPVVPDTLHPTNRRARYLVDLGSNGEIRRIGMIESSGDPVFDQAGHDALARSTFTPQMQGCISTSSIVPEEFNVPLINLVQPSAIGSGGHIAVPTSAPAAQLAICTSSFVQLNGLDIPETRQAPGTVAIDVGLNAAGHVTSVKLAKSSGNAKTDATGVSAARDGQYAITLPPGCRPQPTIYRLELTYH